MFERKIVFRKQDYAPDGRLGLMCQPNGDIVVFVVDEDNYHTISVGFTEPTLGGSGSPRTAKALDKLLKAMEKDNSDPRYQFRAVHD